MNSVRKTATELVLRSKVANLINNDSGMSTIEYAMGSVAAAALAAVLYMVVNGGGVTDAFESILTDALNNRPG